MNMKNTLKNGTLIGLMAMTWACGDANPTDGDAALKSDVAKKTLNDKADRWNYRNDPARFRMQFDYKLDNLPSEGSTEKIAWAASYWPVYKDGINHRWQGHDILSPAEKYDKAYNGWEPDENFMDLKPFDLDTCEFDEAYYDQLGQAATHVTHNNGNFRAHNGIDDDGDGVEDKDECQEHEDNVTDYDGIETWFGICHAWAPAAVLEDEPLKAVEHNGVRFETSDIKALLIQQYDRTSAYLMGGRCNEDELERDDTGRIIKEECRDLNAGSWHVAITNLLGKDKRAFVIERTTNYEVWNQPLIGYTITAQNEISANEAVSLLNLDRVSEGNGEFVHGIEEESDEAKAILEFVNTATFTQLDDDARLYRNAASNITFARPFATLASLDEVPQVSARAFESLAQYVSENGLVGIDAYIYNQETVKFVEIEMTTDWVTESHPRIGATTPINSRYVRHDSYHYILELDANDEIIGGEWVGSSNTAHPDFIWTPTGQTSGNPYISIDEVRNLIALSREDVVTPGDGEVFIYSDATTIAIPDADPAGISSVLTSTDPGTVRRVTISVDIDHTYRGDLLIQLRHGSGIATIFDGQIMPNASSENIIITDQLVEGFLGSQIEGEWEILVVDTTSVDSGSLNSWSLNVEAK